MSVPFCHRNTQLSNYKTFRRLDWTCVCLCSCLSCPAQKLLMFWSVLYCFLQPAWWCHILPHYLISGFIFGRHLSSIKCVFWFSLQLFSVTFLIPRRIKRDTRAAQWETGKVVLKIAYKTDVIVCRICEVGDLELPIAGIDTPAARIGTWETVRQDGGALATVH